MLPVSTRSSILTKKDVPNISFEVENLERMHHHRGSSLYLTVKQGVPRRNHSLNGQRYTTSERREEKENATSFLLEGHNAPMH